MRRAAPARHAAAAALILAFALAQAARADEAAVERGAYIFAAAGCVSCHTDVKHHGTPLAGGRPLSTPFGTFYSPNITADRQHGIGGWSLADFKRALRDGKDDDGDFLFPVFPYPSYTGMTDQDIADLYAYLMTQPPSAQADKPHEVKFPFGFRPLQRFWRYLFFNEGPLAAVPDQSAEWNRGRYLVEAVAHCEECHTPRNFLGALDRSRAFAGNPQGPDGQKAPNITPDPATGIGKWSIDDITTVLASGMTPDFDSVGGGMGEVVAGTEKLTDTDRHAIAVYVKSLPPLRATGK
ncbi:MAG TPA: cytochrome c [Stellaceae bacterium]|nr:cytochrome c [Stellaceae bacterium]